MRCPQNDASAVERDRAAAELDVDRDASRAGPGAGPGDGRRALIGMSYKGPSTGEQLRPKPSPLTTTGTGDAPGRSSRFLRPRRPRHLATAAPPRQAAEDLYGIFVSDRSRSPRGERVGRVLRGTTPRRQGLSQNFFHILRVPASPPQQRPRHSTEPTPDLHRNPTRLWIPACIGTVSREPSRGPGRRRAGGPRGRRVRRSGPPRAGRRGSRPPGGTAPGSRSR
jgi:hypothetical protein